MAATSSGSRPAARSASVTTSRTARRFARTATQTSCSGGIGPRIGHDDAVLAVPLRFVERFVGRGHELFGVFELALDRDAEARGHTYLGAVGKLDCRRLERGAQALGELPCADYVCLG